MSLGPDLSYFNKAKWVNFKGKTLMIMHACCAVLLSNDTALEMCRGMSEVRRSDLVREQERTGWVAAPEGAAVAVDGAGAAAGKSAAV